MKETIGYLSLLFFHTNEKKLQQEKRCGKKGSVRETEIAGEVWTVHLPSAISVHRAPAVCFLSNKESRIY